MMMMIKLITIIL